MKTTLLTVKARHISHRTSCIHNQRELLRRRPNPQPRRVAPVGEEIVIEPHVGVGHRSLEPPAVEGSPVEPIGFGRREMEMEDHRTAVTVGE
ncbi:hypothetical protein ACFX2B_013118 [Malus domestica]